MSDNDYLDFLRKNPKISFRQSLPKYRQSTGNKISNEKGNVLYRDFYGLEFNIKKSQASSRAKKIKGNYKPFIYGDVLSDFYLNNKSKIIREFKRFTLTKKMRYRGYLLITYEYDEDIYYHMYGFISFMEFNLNLEKIDDIRSNFTAVYSICLRDYFFTKIKDVKKRLEKLKKGEKNYDIE